MDRSPNSDYSGCSGALRKLDSRMSDYSTTRSARSRSDRATRGVAILATLLMVMLGGAWVPTFIFPAWLQRLTVVVPARWAVDGLDAMTWRGVGLSGAIVPTLV